MKADMDIRRQLLDMTTRDTLTFGVLKVRLYKSRYTVRWQITSADVAQAFRHSRYADVHTVNEVLWQVTTYILQNRDGERRLCPHCGLPVRRSKRAVYCSAACQTRAADRRQREREKLLQGNAV